MTLNDQPAALDSAEGFYSAVLASKGRSPAEVARELGVQLPVTLSDPAQQHTKLNAPDHSIMRGEWYFTRQTAAEIAGRTAGNCLLVGMPTVASHLPGCTLVESSPWAGERVDLGTVNLVAVDFEEYRAEERFDVVAFDPPWYLPDFTNWINNAAYFSRPGAQLMFPLFGEGTRPTAAAERQEIIRECERLGSLRVIPEAVEYDTPRFEVEALRASGVIAHSPWRRCDLVILDVKQVPDEPVSTRQPNIWKEFRIGDRLVAVHTLFDVSGGVDPDSKALLLEVPGIDGRVMDTASRRDPRWKYVNVWFSHNRVARTRQPQRLIELLQDFSKGIRSGDYAAELSDWIQ